MFLADPARLAALHQLHLLDALSDPIFDRSVQLAATFVRVPVVMLSLLDEDRHFVLSQIGLPEAWAVRRTVPLEYSFCKHVIELGEALIISDTRVEPLVYDNPSVRDLNAFAYAGIPLRTMAGHVIGVFAVIDQRPRQWTDDEIALLTTLAQSVMQDINQRDLKDTQTKERNALYERVNNLEQMKTEMIRVAAHDLRNPLGLVMGYSELMIEESDLLTDHHREFVASIYRSGKKMLTLINDILSLERLTAAKNENYQPVMIGELAQSVYEANQESAANQGLVYQFEADDLALETMGDPVELREAMENLVANAIKYTRGGGTVIVRARLQGDLITFQVEDTGYGVPEDEQSRLFTPFFRSHAEETYRIGGTGLGLHLVKTIIERHMGEVTFKSVPGQGSTFGFYLHRA